METLHLSSFNVHDIEWMSEEMKQHFWLCKWEEVIEQNLLPTRLGSQTQLLQ